MVYDNRGFESDELGNATTNNIKHVPISKLDFTRNTNKPPDAAPSVPAIAPKERDGWGNDIEFLFSCIAMSVGLGNVWRFPFAALDNGGGAFLIPYFIVLFVVGRPIYYLEMIVGQFSSRGSAKVYDMVPAMRGTGYGQVIAVFWLCTYYASTMAVITRYLIDSFQPTLPWANCKNEWQSCISSSQTNNHTNNLNYSFTSVVQGSHIMSSSEHYFTNEVLKEKDNIDDGIGIPDWRLGLCLLASWGCVLIILVKGVRSSGKASYFLAVFPYVGMGILLVRACTLEGAADGILYFIKPQFGKLLDPTVWYAAVTQCFFSLSVCFGNIIMYSSYNKFSHNIYRDSTVVALLDTFTSLIAGCTIFAILGHLAHLTGSDDIGSVVKGGTGLAFISYPDAIAKFEWLPQLFSVVFFFMLFVLGVGSNIAMTSCVMTVIRDQFPSVKAWHAASGVTMIGLLIGFVYVTPGGQFVLNLVDFFGASFTAYILAIAELIAFGWIYGVNRICQDTVFMTGKNPGLYWRICWGFLTPLLMVAILLYTFFTYQPLKYHDIYYPDSAYAAGWTISAFGIVQLPLWCIYAIIKQKGDTWLEKIQGAFRPKSDWGPSDPVTFQRYQKYRTDNCLNIEIFENDRWYNRVKRNVFG
ncbi:sodium-dependent nutrient amino acid transporter 1-like isoform X1 [Bradysia coprophila]|uniref:sodium-dependent nutrient amino acid transporter 1-like isoform X1 n=1 Tax=Bradysia coprophila TaxID=38358 RepID=UPI00187DD3BC|nr:sodium-dependent nutrient amino acid transporter 1-like isoform X1 [Bradysia coprophila]